MAAHYTNVTQSEIEQYLFPQGFAQASIYGTNELVYEKPVRDGLILRVYSGINPSGFSRRVGEDAMRVTVFMKHADQFVMVGGSKRVHRVQGWRANLQNRLDSWEENLPERQCPHCNYPLVLRKGKFGEFYGCSHFPACRHTEAVRKVAA